MTNKTLDHFVTELESTLQMNFQPAKLKEIEQVISSIYDMGYENGNNDGFEAGYEKASNDNG